MTTRIGVLVVGLPFWQRLVQPPMQVVPPGHVTTGITTTVRTTTPILVTDTIGHKVATKYTPPERGGDDCSDFYDCDTCDDCNECIECVGVVVGLGSGCRG